MSIRVSIGVAGGLVSAEPSDPTHLRIVLALPIVASIAPTDCGDAALVATAGGYSLGRPDCGNSRPKPAERASAATTRLPGNRSRMRFRRSLMSRSGHSPAAIYLQAGGQSVISVTASDLKQTRQHWLNQSCFSEFQLTSSCLR